MVINYNVFLQTSYVIGHRTISATILWLAPRKELPHSLCSPWPHLAHTVRLHHKHSYILSLCILCIIYVCMSLSTFATITPCSQPPRPPSSQSCAAFMHVHQIRFVASSLEEEHRRSLCGRLTQYLVFAFAQPLVKSLFWFRTRQQLYIVVFLTHLCPDTKNNLNSELRGVSTFSGSRKNTSNIYWWKSVVFKLFDLPLFDCILTVYLHGSNCSYLGGNGSHDLNIQTIIMDVITAHRQSLSATNIWFSLNKTVGMWTTRRWPC